MSTTSEVKKGLDAIADRIANQQQRAADAKATLADIDAELAGLPGEFSAEIATVNGFTPTGDFESHSKDELALLTTEFQALRAAVQAAAADLP